MSFPLVPRGRLIGLSFGTMRSLRRGTGSDVAGSRPYVAGDDVHGIDWAASARLSSARGGDEFVVREHYADEAPRVVIVCDRRPEMSYFAPPLPWLDKAAAMREAAALILESAAKVGGFVGYLDHGEGDPLWLTPRTVRRLREDVEERLQGGPYEAPENALELAFEQLLEHRRAVAPGSFIFLLSDFVPPPPERLVVAALEHRWDLVPVVIQDPTWEQSFPAAHGIGLPFRDPRSGRAAPEWLTAGEAGERRERHERRLAELVTGLRSLDADPVLVGEADSAGILGSFLDWADARLTRRAA